MNTREQIDALCKGLAPAIKQYVERELAPVLSKIAELEQRTLYAGVYKPDKKFKAGNFCTHKGSLWHCDMSVQGVAPGDGDRGASYWTLAVKAGRRDE